MAANHPPAFNHEHDAALSFKLITLARQPAPPNYYHYDSDVQGFSTKPARRSGVQCKSRDASEQKGKIGGNSTRQGAGTLQHQYFIFSISPTCNQNRCYHTSLDNRDSDPTKNRRKSEVTSQYHHAAIHVQNKMFMTVFHFTSLCI